MNELELFDELTHIDDAFILEAHETPQRSPVRFGGFRRAAVLIAAVMLMVVTVVAGGDFGVLRPTGWVRGSNNTSFVSDRINREMIIYDDGIYSVEGLGDLQPEITSRAGAAGMQATVICEGVQLQIIQEAMLLMPDGTSAYKAQVTEGADEVVAVMDNLVDGVAGEICNTRVTVSVLTEETELDYDRHSTPGPDGKVWALLQNWNFFLPTQIGYEYPTGVDFRFPDMQYNYDGRGTPESTQKEGTP